MENIREKLPKSELMDYAMTLEQHHSVFYRIIALSQLCFDSSIPTACVQFFPDDGEPIHLLFNPTYWDSLSKNERLWILAHEMWHIINGHGRRMIVLQTDSDREAMNRAMDIAVHYSLENSLGMDREEFFPIWRNYCFTETIFPNRTDVLEGQNAEYYYNLIKQQQAGNSGGSRGSNTKKGDNGQNDDLITWEPGNFNEEIEKQIFDKLADSMSQEEIRNLIDFMNGNNSSGLQPGSGSLGAWLAVRVPPVKPKPRWETIIKKWVRKRIREEFAVIESWADLSRRMAQVFEINKNMFLPVEIEKYLEAKDKNRNKILLFMDASGSCSSHKNRFFAAARSIPKKRFDVELCSFDTKVFKLDINKPTMRGGGGTCFSIMEDYIQQVYIPEHGHYPDAVFLITDGYGNKFQPQYPERWYWFMTAGHSLNYIPKGSHIYYLKDFS